MYHICWAKGSCVGCPKKGEKKKRERQKRYDKHKTQTDETLIYGDAFLFQQEVWF